MFLITLSVVDVAPNDLDDGPAEGEAHEPAEADADADDNADPREVIPFVLCVVLLKCICDF